MYWARSVHNSSKRQEFIPVFRFASTAQLTQQIENSAPFDLFAAVDSEHIAKLEREKLLVSGSRVVCAGGSGDVDSSQK